ncbi:hypothetical protein [Tractidigestivibacter sp.]|uniref:hypothetical protein n=1 Tax=Tractidigestivibacter sp. TaxID=2847320 RepID=UPI002A9116F4|nr:hypothetical protein [Tractidigestivibacter sp.]MDY5272095.1 hypothetical protein [Tractidigestivibacter sp.]
MRRNILRLFLVPLTAAALIALPACGSSQQSDSQQEQPAEETTAEPEPELKTIGTASDADGVYKVDVTNETGKAITSITYKFDDEGAWGSNLLADGDSFAADEERLMYVDLSSRPDAVSKASTDGTLTYPAIAVEITLEDGTVADLHEFPLDSVESLAIKTDGTVYYVEYTLDGSSDTVSTQADEQGIYQALQNAAAEAQAQADAAASAQSQKNTTSFTTSSKGSGSSSSSSSSSSKGSSSSSSSKSSSGSSSSSSSNSGSSSSGSSSSSSSNSGGSTSSPDAGCVDDDSAAHY